MRSVCSSFAIVWLLDYCSFHMYFLYVCEWTCAITFFQPCDCFELTKSIFWKWQINAISHRSNLLWNPLILERDFFEKDFFTLEIWFALDFVVSKCVQLCAEFDRFQSYWLCRDQSVVFVYSFLFDKNIKRNLPFSLQSRDRPHNAEFSTNFQLLFCF